MIDITRTVWRSWTLRHEWSPTQASLVAWTASELWGLDIEWEPEVGESWIMLHRENAQVGALGAELPLVLVTEPLARHAWPYPVAAVTMASLADPILSCDRGTLEIAFGGRCDPTSVPPRAFTALDLCMSTI